MHREFEASSCDDAEVSFKTQKMCINISEFISNSSFHRVLEDDAYNKNNELIKIKKEGSKESSDVLEEKFIILLRKEKKLKITK